MSSSVTAGEESWTLSQAAALASRLAPKIARVEATHPSTPDNDSNYLVDIKVVGDLPTVDPNSGGTTPLGEAGAEFKRINVGFTMPGEGRGLQEGDLVVVAYLDGESEDPVIISTYYHDRNQAFEIQPGDWRNKFGDIVADILGNESEIYLGKQTEGRGTLAAGIYVDVSAGSLEIFDETGSGVCIRDGRVYISGFGTTNGGVGGGTGGGGGGGGGGTGGGGTPGTGGPSYSGQKTTSGTLAPGETATFNYSGDVTSLILDPPDGATVKLDGKEVDPATLGSGGGGAAPSASTASAFAATSSTTATASAIGTSSTGSAPIDPDATSSRPTGPHSTVESVRYRAPEPEPDPDGKTPAEQFDAYLAAEAAAEVEPADASHLLARTQSTPQHLTFGLEPGDETLLSRVEIDLVNLADTPLTDTIQVALSTVNVVSESEPPTELWPAAVDAPGRETQVTLDPGERTTLLVSGDASLSVLSRLTVENEDSPELVGVTSLPVAPSIETVVDVTSLNASDGDASDAIQFDATAVFGYSAEWLDAWFYDGNRRTIGPRGKVRQEFRVNGEGVAFPRGVTDASERHHRALVSGTGYLGNAGFDGNGVRHTPRTIDPPDAQIGDTEYFSAGTGEFDPGSGEGLYVRKSTGWSLIA